MNIEVRDIVKCIKGEAVLNHLSICFKENTSYGIVGANGSGKSMLLRAICGMMQLDSGEVWVDNKKVGSSEYPFIQDAGIIIGEATFQKNLTGYSNLKQLAEIRGRIADEEIEEVMKKVGIYHARDKKFGSYSLGMKQRLKIAQAIMEQPKLLILDEPFNGLDKEGVMAIRELLLKYKQDGTVLILTSHNEKDIEILCDVVIEMDRGELYE